MFLLIVSAAIILRVYLIVRDSVPFAYDMGRDLLWAKDIAFYSIPTLIGPAASIWGVYFGPAWFYFLAIPLFITGGHPLSAVYATAAVIITTGVLAYWLFKKYLTKSYALLLAVIILFSTTSINLSTFAFHANVLSLLTLLLIYFCFLAVVANSLFLPLAFLMVSAMFHADPAPAVVLTIVPIFTFFYFKLYQSKKLVNLLSLSFLGYLIPFLPQLLFEIRHNFVQTQSLIAYFAGQNPSLAGHLPLSERIPNRLSIFFDFFKASFAGGQYFLAILFLLIFIFGIHQFLKGTKVKKLLTIFQLNAAILIISFLIFTLLITVEVKNWYLYGLIVPFAWLITLSVYGLKNYRYFMPIFLIFYLVFNILPFFRNERLLLSKSDPAQLANQMQVIDLIYADSANKPFSVYIFTPSIYDHHYQYLFWWQGSQLKKGLPQDFAYLPNQPSYVPNKSVWAPTPVNSDTVYLIIEKSKENEFYTSFDWLKNFDDLQLIWQENINNALIVQKRTR